MTLLLSSLSSVWLQRITSSHIRKDQRAENSFAFLSLLNWIPSLWFSSQRSFHSLPTLPLSICLLSAQLLSVHSACYQACLLVACFPSVSLPEPPADPVIRGFMPAAFPIAAREKLLFYKKKKWLRVVVVILWPSWVKIQHILIHSWFVIKRFTFVLLLHSLRPARRYSFTIVKCLFSVTHVTNYFSPYAYVHNKQPVCIDVC